MGKLSCGISIPGVYERDGRYYKVIKGRWHPLSRIDEGINALYRALYDLDPRQPGTIRELIELYRIGGMEHLKSATRRDYLNILVRLEHHFGHMLTQDLRLDHVAQFLEARRRGGKGAARANREAAVGSSVYEFGLRNGWVRMNPFRGVRRNPERPRSRHVTDAEFLDAFERANEPFQDLIAAAYLSGCRQTDVIGWRRSEHLRPEGIVYRQSKTGKPHTVGWSKALAFFVNRAVERFPQAEPPEDFIFLNTEGRRWSVWAIDSQLDRLGVDWTFKDLRSKAQTDSPHSVLGHGAALEALYRKALRTKPVR